MKKEFFHSLLFPELMKTKSKTFHKIQKKNYKNKCLKKKKKKKKCLTVTFLLPFALQRSQFISNRHLCWNFRLHFIKSFFKNYTNKAFSFIEHILDHIPSTIISNRAPNKRNLRFLEEFVMRNIQRIFRHNHTYSYCIFKNCLLRSHLQCQTPQHDNSEDIKIFHPCLPCTKSSSLTLGDKSRFYFP